MSTFKDLISPTDYKVYEKTKENRPTWYNLTADVFIKFLYKVWFMHSSSPSSNLDNFHADYIGLQGHFLQRDISAQADLAMRHYRETKPVAEMTATKIWNVMTKAQERTIKRIRARILDKYISVTHPDNGEAFFHEVSCRDFYISNAMNVPLICVFS